jgi:hypothetical protein
MPMLQIIFYLSHAPNTTGVVDLTVKRLLKKPLTNNAVQEIELRKYLENKVKHYKK